MAVIDTSKFPLLGAFYKYSAIVLVHTSESRVHTVFIGAQNELLGHHIELTIVFRSFV